jgi:hypothetical protein
MIKDRNAHAFGITKKENNYFSLKSFVMIQQHSFLFHVP